jgi:hypothetical protein
MAAKLARLVYRMLRYGMKYVNRGAKFYEAQHRKQQISYLKWKAQSVRSQTLQLSYGRTKPSYFSTAPFVVSTMLLVHF